MERKPFAEKNNNKASEIFQQKTPRYQNEKSYEVYVLLTAAGVGRGFVAKYDLCLFLIWLECQMVGGNKNIQRNIDPFPVHVTVRNKRGREKPLLTQKIPSVVYDF